MYNLKNLITFFLLSFLPLAAESITYSVQNLPTNPALTITPNSANPTKIQLDYYASALFPKFDPNLGRLTDVIFDSTGASFGANFILSSTLPAGSTSEWGATIFSSATVNAPAMPDALSSYWTDKFLVGSFSSSLGIGPGSIQFGIMMGTASEQSLPQYSTGGLPPSFLSAYLAQSPGETFTYGLPISFYVTGNNAELIGSTLNPFTQSIDLSHTYVYSLSTPEPSTYLMLGSSMLFSAFLAVRFKRKVIV